MGALSLFQRLEVLVDVFVFYILRSNTVRSSSIGKVE